MEGYLLTEMLDQKNGAFPSDLYPKRVACFHHFLSHSTGVKDKTYGLAR